MRTSRRSPEPTTPGAATPLMVIPATVEIRQLTPADVPGFCKAAKLDDIRKHDYVLTPGRYVGAAEQEADGEPFPEKMKRLTAILRQQQAEAAKLDAAIAANLKDLGYGNEA